MNKKSKLETRNASLEFELRAIEDERGYVLEGYAVVYDSPTTISDWRGEYIEVVEKGALDHTNLKDVRMLINHDLVKIPVARSRNNNENSTMKLFVDEKGLGFKAILDKENSESRNLWSAVNRGDITGVSYLFASKGDVWENTKEGRKRHIKEISTVVEISPVTFPAYEETSISARNKSPLDNGQGETDDSHGLVDTRQKNYEIESLKKMYS